MRNVELAWVLAYHQKWLDGDSDGIRANLSKANLSGDNLSRANLSKANLSRADLSRANLSGANLSGADLSEVDLSGADLSRADLSRANLSKANLSGANLSGADLSRANLSGTKAWFGYFGRYFVASVGANISIGCQSHSASSWKLFSDQVIAEMAPGAVEYWARYKNAILAINEATNK